MFVEELRRAVMAAPREKLTEVSAVLWKAYAGGALEDDDASSISALIEARKATPVAAARQRVGSRPRSPEHAERRRRWAASGWLPPTIACRFTLAEVAVLSVIAVETMKGRGCRLPIAHIAQMAGVCRSTVRNAVRAAVALGLVRNEEWRLSAFRNAPNTVTIISAEWSTWLRLRGGGHKTVKGFEYRKIQPLQSLNLAKGKEAWRGREGRGRQSPFQARVMCWQV